MQAINFEFREEVLKHNASLSYCYQCATCSNSCPVAFLTEGIYNPRKIIQELILGFKDRLIEGKELNIWLCCTCQKCVELCPQKVKLTEIFTLIKNECFKNKNYPDAFSNQAKAIYNNSVAIPYSQAILSRREKMGLPLLKIASIKEIQELLKLTKFNEYIK